MATSTSESRRLIDTSLALSLSHSLLLCSRSHLSSIHPSVCLAATLSLGQLVHQSLSCTQSIDRHISSILYRHFDQSINLSLVMKRWQRWTLSLAVFLLVWYSLWAKLLPITLPQPIEDILPLVCVYVDRDDDGDDDIVKPSSLSPSNC